MSHYAPKTRTGRAIHAFEETLIALILAAMTVITFWNVIERYVFASNILWALEVTVFLFAWLVLLGAAHVVKINGHLGVDALVKVFPRGMRKVIGLIAVSCCLVFAGFLVVGSWNYWAPFANLPPLWVIWNENFAEMFSAEPVPGSFFATPFYEVESIPMLEVFAWLEPLINEGEEYEKLPRAVAYILMPLSSVLLFARFVELGWKVATGRVELIVAAHEAEEAEAAAAEEREAADRAAEADRTVLKGGQPR